jgi:hypothetical protein
MEKSHNSSNDRDNKSISILITPELFLYLYDMVYKFDKNIGTVKETALIMNIAFMMIGILGSIGTLIVFFQKKLLESRLNRFLVLTTIFKLIFCLITFLDYIFSKVYSEGIFLHDLNKVSGKIVDFLMHTSDSCIALLAIFTTLDRFYSIRNPSFLKTFLIYLHTKRLLIASLVLFVLFLMLTNILCEFPKLGIGSSHFIYCSIIAPTMFNTIPVFILLALNILLVKETIKYYRECQSKGSVFFNKKRESSLTPIIDIKMMNDTTYQTTIFIKNEHANQPSFKSHYLIIILTNSWSILTSLPYYLLNSFFILFHLNYFELESVIIFQIISSILFNSNHCFNFFINLFFHQKFKSIVTNFFYSKILGRKPSSIDYV